LRGAFALFVLKEPMSATRNEAEWFAGEVLAGRMTVETARTLIGVPASVRAQWSAWTQEDLIWQEFADESLKFRTLVAKDFEALLLQEERVQAA